MIFVFSIKKTPNGCPPEFFESYRRMPDRFLGELYIDCVQAFFAFFCLESDGVALPDFVNQSADVNEKFLASS